MAHTLSKAAPCTYCAAARPHTPCHTDAPERPSSLPSVPARLAAVDIVVVSEVLGACLSSAREAAGAEAAGACQAWTSWLAFSRAVAMDVEALLWLAAEAAAPPALAQRLADAVAAWRGLRVLQLYVRDVLLLSGGASHPLERDAFDAMCAAAKLSPPGSLASLHSLMRAASAAARGAAHRGGGGGSGGSSRRASGNAHAPVLGLSAFLCSAVRFVVLRAVLAGDPLRSPLDGELVRALVGLAAGSGPPTAGSEPSLPRPSRAQRALLLHSMRRAAPELPALAAQLPAVAAAIPHGTALWLRHEEEGASTSAQNDAPQLVMTTAEAEHAVLLGEGDAMTTRKEKVLRDDGVKALRALAKAKVLVARYATALHHLLRGRDDDSGRAATALLDGAPRTLLCHLRKPIEMRTFVLRILWCSGGLPNLSKMLALPVSALPWLPIAAAAGSQLMQAQTLVDPFCWLLPQGSGQASSYAEVRYGSSPHRVPQRSLHPPSALASAARPVASW